jgi:hypothetical protein
MTRSLCSRGANAKTAQKSDWPAARRANLAPADTAAIVLREPAWRRALTRAPNRANGGSARHCGLAPRAYLTNMHTPLQITYRGLPHSEAVDQNIQKRAERLARAHPGITACHVTVELPHQHHQRGNHYRVQVFLAVPGANLVVSRGDTVNPAYEDVHIVIRDVFNAALRRLEERLRRPRAQRGARVAAAIDATPVRWPA